MLFETIATFEAKAGGCAGQGKTRVLFPDELPSSPIANALVEAAVNPLIATVYPDQKTQKLNLLHAWFPWGFLLSPPCSAPPILLPLPH